MIDLIFLLINLSQNVSTPTLVSNFNLTNFDYFNQTLAIILAALISALVSICLFHRQNQKNFRIAYITTIFHNEAILNKFSKLFSNLYTLKKQKEMAEDNTLKSLKSSINFEVREPELLLFFAPSPKLYNKLITDIETERWIDAIDVILRFISGNW